MTKATIIQKPRFSIYKCQATYIGVNDIVTAKMRLASAHYEKKIANRAVSHQKSSYAIEINLK